MFIVSQNGRTIFTDYTFIKIRLYRAVPDAVIEGEMPDGDKRVVLARYSLERRAEAEFGRLKQSIEKGDKIFYFQREAKGFNKE